MSGGNLLAKNYAMAALGLLQDTAGAGSVDAACIRLEEELKSVDELKKTSKEFRTVFFGAVTNAAEKGLLISELLKAGKISAFTSQFLQLLAKKGRLGILGEIIRMLEVVRVELQGGVMGELVVADEATGALVEEFETLFSGKFGKKIVFKVKQDADLIAGVRVLIGGVTYDASLRSKLDRFRAQCLGAI